MSEDNVSLTSTGLIRELADFIWDDGEIKTHPDWVESLACALIGMIMGKDRRARNQYGELYGNIFSIIVGASGISFKTVALKPVRRLLKRVAELLNDEICIRYGFTSCRDYKEKKKDHDISKPRRRRGAQSNEAKERYNEWLDEDERINRIRLVDFEGPTKFTSEGLAIFLMDHPQCLVAGDEYTKLFKGAKKKDYLTDNMEDLSRLYDREAEKYITAGRGIEYPEDGYVSFVSATTYQLLTMMEDDFFLQGTGNRILWILDDLEGRRLVDVEKEAEKFAFWWKVKDEEIFNKKLDELAHKLLAIRRLPEVPHLVALDFKSGVKLDKYRLEKYNLALIKIQKDLFDIDGNLISRLAQNAMKLALIHCVGRYALDAFDEGPGYSPDGFKIEMNDEDADWAIAKAERHFEHYIKMFKQIAPRARKGYLRSYRTDKDRVFIAIDKIDGLTFAKLYAEYSWDPEETMKLVNGMIGADEAMWIRARNKSGSVRTYRGVTVRHLKRYNEEEYNTEMEMLRNDRNIIDEELKKQIEE